MIKIYQIHEYVGSYEDRCDNIIHSCFDENKANAKCDELNKQSALCAKCQMSEEYACRKHDLEERLKDDNICEKFELYEDDGWCSCSNSLNCSFYGTPNYEVKIVEVEE